MIHIDRHKFRLSHDAFLRHMEAEGEGIPFTGFGHRFFVTNEVAYKQEALRQARKAVQFPQWASWSRKSGRIVESLKEACKPAISANLMEHRYGDRQNSYKSLYLLSDKEMTKKFEAKVRALHCVAQETDAAIGPVFDDFSRFLQDNRLGCQWSFAAVGGEQNVVMRYVGVIKLFRIANNAVAELDGHSVTLEKSLQTLIERHLDEFLGIRKTTSADDIAALTGYVRGGGTNEDKPPSYRSILKSSPSATMPVAV